MILFEQFGLAYLEFLTQQVLGVINRVAQHIADGEELWFVVLNNTAVGRDIHLAVGEGIKGIESLVGRHSRGEMHLYLHLCSSIVIYLTCLYLAFFDGLEDRVDESGRSLAERYLAYDKGLVVEFLYLRSHLKRASTLSVVVFSHVDTAPGGEVGEELEGTVVEIGNGGITYLAEVMRKNLG